MAQMYSFMADIEDVVPWNAKYALPNQTTRAWKSVMKFPPLNASTFSSKATGTPIKIVLPAQGYLDTSKTVLEFDLTIFRAAGDSTNPPTLRNCRVQNGIQSIFKRVTEYYGSLPLEDDDYYNVRYRMLTEALGTNQNGGCDNNGIADGIGGTKLVVDDAGLFPIVMNARNHSIQGYNQLTTVVAGPTAGTTSYTVTPTGVRQSVITDNSTIPRRYCVKLATGLFQQGKLIPLQWLASALQIQIELATFNDCMSADRFYNGQGLEYYEVSNVNLIATILNFDGSYEAGFLQGLQNGGVPLKFTAWDHYALSMPANTSVQQQIPERNRSLKAIFTVQLPPSQLTGTAATNTVAAPIDSHAMLQSSSGYANGVSSASTYLQRFQFRVGSKYYPLQPVECGDTSHSNGAAEAYVELAKALNILGDTRMSTAVTPSRWCRFGAANAEYSYAYDWVGGEYGGNSSVAAVGQYGPSFFVMSTSFETSDGSEISGINGEEQNDITVLATWKGAQLAGCELKSFIAFDSIMMIGANNLVELIK
jgi:hypothetical protein